MDRDFFVALPRATGARLSRADEEAAQRAKVVEEAKSWLLTPYHHNAMVKGAGVDCGLLLLAVYKAAGIIPQGFKVAPYAHDWHLHRDEEMYLNLVRQFGREIDYGDVRPGDVGVWKFGRTHAHGAIFVEPPIVVQAMRRDRMVVLSDASRDHELVERPVVYLSPWG